jgi:hypothetical protein
MAYTPSSATSFTGIMSLGAMLALALALALSARDAHADLPPAAKAPRPTFRLEYRLLDSTSQQNCPLESVTRSLLNRMFGYEAIDDKAGPGFVIDVASSEKPAYFEALAYLTREISSRSLSRNAGLSYRRGDWSGGFEVRLEHGLVAADIEKFSVESLYAGAALVAPCVHEGAFSGCFVLEGGGYSFNVLREPTDLAGRFTMLGLGMRGNLEHRVGEHFLPRGFVQVSAMPLTPSVDLADATIHWWHSGPGFGTVGLTVVSLP